MPLIHDVMAKHPVPLAIATVVAAVVLVCIADSTVWVGRPFMGFLLGRNRIVAPIGFAHWTGIRAGVPFGSELVSVEARPVDSTSVLVEETWARRVGTPMHYVFATPSGTVERVVPLMRFTLLDYVLLFGNWLVNGGVFLVLGFAVAYLKPGRPASVAMTVFCTAWGLTLVLPLSDFYLFHFRSLYAIAQAVFPSALFVLALTFPDRPLPRWAPALLVGLGFLTSLQAGLDIALYDRAPRVWMRLFGAEVGYGAAVALAACALIFAWYRRAPREDRLRVQLVALGSVIAFGVPAVIHLAALLADVPLPFNLLLPIGSTVFPIVVTYAIVKHDFLDLDPLLTRGVFYVLVSAAVMTGYVALIGLAHALGPGSLHPDWVPFLFTLVALAALAPMRRTAQALVDRLFFRTRYDPEAAAEAVSRSLAASLDRNAIVNTIHSTLEQTIAPYPCLLLLPDGQMLREPRGVAVAAWDPVLETAPGPGATVAPVLADTGPGARALVAAGAALIIPLRAEDDLVGLLALGPKRLGAYGAHDLRLLRTVANQAAMALRNAVSYSTLQELTATLEQRVGERTRDLARSHEALLAAQAQVARADKLASLGRLVAGIAHEINNPVAFINSSVDLIHEAALTLCTKVDGAADKETAERLQLFMQNVSICRDSAARAARVVRELTAFAHASQDGRQPTDVHAILERSLELLRGEWRDRITIEREYGDIPHPIGNPGQLDQVFLNLLTNAMQAVEGPGTVQVRTYAHARGVFVEVQDSGRGIAPEVQERIFEPFFTTKPIGEGTGLGLAIAHSLVARHGGEILVRSAPGEGATFTVRLPIDPPGAP
jgi:signal transduction histidine kinase